MKTKEELNALKEEVETLNKKLADLTEEELAQVTGGDLFDEFSQWLSSDMDYKSGDTPKFSPGQKIIFYYLDNWWDGHIVSVDSKDGGIFDTEFLYTVKHLGYTKTVSGIYESNIRAR